MSSLSHALALADTVRYQLDTVGNHPEHSARTDEEVAAGNAQKEKARSALKSSIALVNQTLAALRKAAPTEEEVAATKKRDRPAVKSSMRLARNMRDTRDVRSNLRSTTLSAQDMPTPVKNVMDAMSADGLKPGTQSLDQMAKAIGPIIEKFDSILTKPYLQNYNATLNSVPVVGLKNNQILYIETKQNSIVGGGGLQEVWSKFSDLPSGVNVTANDKVYMFPYKGDFCLSVGKAVWKKAHIASNDPSLPSAADNWPNLYNKDWVKLGDNVLPAADLKGVVPFAVLSADREEIAFQLVVLRTDGSLAYLTSSDLVDSAVFEPLQYKPASGSPTTAPVFTKIAYWNNNIIGVDASSQTWNATPTWSAGTWSAADPLKIDAVSEFTATDVGLIGLRSDGYLYKRIVEVPDDGSDDATLKWTRWIKADGATHIGVASPGVILDLKTLTRTLRSRYIDVQTSVYPVVDKIRAFGITHVFYLNQVMQDALDWQNADSEEKQKLAIKNAKSFVGHAKTWSTIVSRSIGGAKESVNIMTKQLHDVRMQLETQLTLLRDRLKALQATLDTQKEALSKLKAAFWGSIAAMFLGVALAVIGVATGQAWLVVGAGILFVAGFVATIALAVKISELAGDIADTESQIRDVNTAIDEMSTIVGAFQELDTLYGTLNQFWGRMQNDASAIKTMDDATAFAIGEEILYDTSSIEAATDMTQKMADACQVYLDVLNKQGIHIPTDAALVSAKTTTRTVVHRARYEAAQVNSVIEAARALLIKGDVQAYEGYMQQAALLHLKSQSTQGLAVVGSGVWYDLPALQSTAIVWSGSSSRSFSSAVDIAGFMSRNSTDIAFAIAAKASSIDLSLSEVRPYVEDMLVNILSLGDTIQGWTARFPDIPTGSQKAEVEALQEKAVTTCEKAQHNAALANNKFADFTNEAREYQQNLETDINGKNNDINRRRASAAEAIRNLSPPWYVYLGGAIAVIAWTETEKARINGELSSAVNALNRSIADLRNLQQSGLTFNGNAQTWIQMAETVSGNLGRVYNILSGVWGQLLEDPMLYKELMTMEWAELVSTTKDVLQILRSGSSYALVSAGLGSPRALFAGPTGQLVDGKKLVMQAVMPSNTLGPRVRGQASDAQTVFTNLELLLTMPYAKDIIGYWESDKTERKTLFDVTASLHTEYVQMVATQYNTIQSLYSLSILQEYRAKNVVEGKLSLPIFIKGTLQSVRQALKAADRTNTQFGDSAEAFKYVLSVIEENINEIEAQVSKLDDNIENAESQLRDKIIWIVADIIAIAFATGVLLATFGILGPIVGAINLYVQIGAGAALTAAGIKLVLDSLSLSDIAKLIASLKGVRDQLRTSVGNLKAVQPLFKDVVAGVKDLTANITDMKDTLEKLEEKLELLGAISLTTEDAEIIKDSWIAVRDDTMTWMDVINAQGISPIIF